MTLYNLKFFIHAQNMYLHLLESFVCLFIGFSMESKIFLHKDLVPFRLIPVFSIAVVNSTVYFLLAVVGIEECSVCVCVCVCVCVLVTQSCPTLCHPMDCSPPGSSVLGVLQARILEWVAIYRYIFYIWHICQTHVLVPYHVCWIFWNFCIGDQNCLMLNHTRNAFKLSPLSMMSVISTYSYNKEISFDSYFSNIF